MSSRTYFHWKVIGFYISILLVAVLFPIGIVQSQPLFELLNGKIQSVFSTANEKYRDRLDYRLPNAQPKYNYFEYPDEFWVSDSIFSDYDLNSDFKNVIDEYLKSDYIPGFFIQNAINF